MSTPFLTLRFALVYARRTATRAYALNGAALVASFAVFRLGANTALLVYAAFVWWRLRLLRVCCSQTIGPRWLARLLRHRLQV